MRASNASTPVADHNGTIFLAIELSQRNWLVTMHSPARRKISRFKLGGNDYAGLLGLIERMRAEAARMLGCEPGVVSCYEAGYDGFWLHRRLTAAGITNLVFDPASIAVEQRARRAKTASMASFCCARCWRTGGASRGWCAWCGCRRRNRKTPGAPHASATG